ncbi:MAG: nuclear transport factor 2 family protein [Gallionellaceae bacterium]|nr:nuclear transport factor 2 family protein [Gallionellaceae bacterium]
MPYLQIYLAPDQLDAGGKARLAAGATRLLADVLRKRPEVTVVRIVATPADQWYAAGGPLSLLGRAAFADLKITRGTNTEAEKARFLAEFHRLLDDTAGPMSAPTYTVIHEIAGTDWGYDGLGQVERGGAGRPAMMTPVRHHITGAESVEPGTPVEALAEFYRAFNGRDLELMRRNWHPDECVLDNPLGGILRGWAEIEPLYVRLFGGPARVHVEFYDYTLHEGADLFVAAGRERGTFERGSTRIELAIRTSRVYRKVAARWRQIHHHGSIEEPELLARYREAVLGG